MRGKAIIKKNRNKYGWDVFFRGMMGYYLTFDSALADALVAIRIHKLTDAGCKE